MKPRIADSSYSIVSDDPAAACIRRSIGCSSRDGRSVVTRSSDRFGWVALRGTRPVPSPAFAATSARRSLVGCGPGVRSAAPYGCAVRKVEPGGQTTVRGATRDDMDARPETVRTLFIHTPVDPPLGADVAVHADIMRALDRRTHEIHLALAEASPGSRRPSNVDWKACRTSLASRSTRDPTCRRVARSGQPSVSSANRSDGSPASCGSVATSGATPSTSSTPAIDPAMRSPVVLGRLCRVPSIVHVHVAHADWMSRQRRWAIAAANHRFAVSDFVRGSLIEAGCRPTARTRS